MKLNISHLFGGKKQMNADGKMLFHTNINCSGCVAKITPVLNNTEGIKEWSVDTTDKNKPLTVVGDGITANEVIELVKGAGFTIEQV